MYFSSISSRNCVCKGLWPSLESVHNIYSTQKVVKHHVGLENIRIWNTVDSGALHPNRSNESMDVAPTNTRNYLGPKRVHARYIQRNWPKLIGPPVAMSVAICGWFWFLHVIAFQLSISVHDKHNAEIVAVEALCNWWKILLQTFYVLIVRIPYLFVTYVIVCISMIAQIHNIDMKQAQVNLCACVRTCFYVHTNASDWHILPSTFKLRYQKWTKQDMIKNIHCRLLQTGCPVRIWTLTPTVSWRLLESRRPFDQCHYVSKGYMYSLGTNKAWRKHV